MRFRNVTTALLTWLALAAAPGQCLDRQAYQEFRQCATQSEHENKWQRINWLKNMDQAKARARAENKPILVFLVIGFHGEKNADDC
jgi:thiol:disulfide interchange protein